MHEYSKKVDTKLVFTVNLRYKKNVMEGSWLTFIYPLLQTIPTTYIQGEITQKIAQGSPHFFHVFDSSVNLHDLCKVKENSRYCASLKFSSLIC